MRNKASLLLMEQLIMVLVFALATALCLQVFVKADEISTQTARQDQAVLLAQNAAELLKSGMEADAIPQDIQYPLEIQQEDSGIPGFMQAKITVYHSGDAQPLFALTTGWQEVAQ